MSSNNNNNHSSHTPPSPFAPYSNSKSAASTASPPSSSTPPAAAARRMDTSGVSPLFQQQQHAQHEQAKPTHRHTSPTPQPSVSVRQPSSVSAATTSAQSVFIGGEVAGEVVDYLHHDDHNHNNQEENHTSKGNTSNSNNNPKYNLAVAANTDVGDEVMRHIYNDKLRVSVQSIVEALSGELPADHVMQQLMADDTTRQYCQVRLTEIVETFLYATQAQQYHNLAATLAQRERDNAVLAERNAYLEHQLLSRPPQVPLVSRSSAAFASKTVQTLDHSGMEANPMAEESARRELMAILEETTREQELDRCRTSLSCAEKLIQVAHADAPNGSRRPAEQCSFVSDVVSELYRSVHTLIGFIDGSLESVEAMRTELEEVERSTTASVNASSVLSTPSRRTASLLLRSGQRTTLPERLRLQELTAKLRDAQVLTARAVDSLAVQTQQHAKEVKQLETSLELARGEAAAARQAAEGARQSQANLEEIRKDHRQTTAYERDEARRQLDAVQDKLDATVQELQQAQQECQRAQMEAERSRDRVQGLTEELQSLRAAHKQDAVATSTLQSNHHALQAVLRERDGELLCTQVELTVVSIEALFHENEAAKMSLLQRHGFSATEKAMDAALRNVKEQIRHTQVQLQLGETAALEKKVSQRASMDQLAALLRSMWEDESVAAALQFTTTDTIGDEDVTNGDADGGDGEGVAQHIQGKYRMPATLAGLAAALEYAYTSMRGRQEAWQRTLKDARAAITQRDARIRALTASERELKLVVQAERDREEQWKAEIESLTSHNPMRDLLSRQESLLRSVSDERNALREQWGTLNADYIALERRNGVLHARCAVKEQENAKLSGLLQSSTIKSSLNTSAPHSNVGTPVAKRVAPDSVVDNDDEATTSLGADDSLERQRLQHYSNDISSEAPDEDYF